MTARRPPGPPRLAVASEYSAPNAPDIPAQVQVGPTRFKVVVDATQCDSTQYGFTRPRHAEFVVNPHQDAQQLRDTVFHEVLHLICDLLGATKGENPLFAEDEEERFVMPFASTILDTLRRNDDLAAFLLAVEE